MIAVTGRITGRDMGSVIRDIKSALKQPDLLPKEVYYSLGGLYAQQQIAFTQGEYGTKIPFDFSRIKWFSKNITGL